MALFISVINHSHDEMICASDTLKTLAKHHTVVVRSNTFPSESLVAYTSNAGIELIVGEKPMGFGANNNAVYRFCKEKLNIQPNDYFLVLNPDVDIWPESIEKLLDLAKTYESDISAINLYKDAQFTEYDNSIRYYHKLLSPIKSLLGYKRTDIYNKDDIKEPITIEWAAGSFLLFKSESYEKLKGFDEKYFMYFEDADICRRANETGMNVMYFPSVRAVHYASHQNRKFMSKHFIWYASSLWRYHFKNQLAH
ncbi:glycosyl transferase [Enterovibrio norvegicus FF-33]|uniref:glycosyltransferase n=1 Tax=Enterovibrio norvegicus TaxID=188144 RepID=UPI0002F43985|nr:glycosyltransferase family 2 protein [Enterovibrio norvegicus]OEE68101.1 glycosyl transferase [Enterovibrio norvegicus FF-33]